MPKRRRLGVRRTCRHGPSRSIRGGPLIVIHGMHLRQLFVCSNSVTSSMGKPQKGPPAVVSKARAQSDKMGGPEQLILYLSQPISLASEVQLKCPNCGSLQSRVTDSRYRVRRQVHIRRRRCGDCGEKYGTEERVVTDFMWGDAVPTATQQTDDDKSGC